MRVSMNKNYKNTFTIADLQRAKEVINSEKDNDNFTVKEWAEMAIREAGAYPKEILKATAETAKNCRVWNIYTDTSENMDVWIEATAGTYDGFIQIGAYLSDIWQTGATEYKDHMYIRKAKFE